ncbi:helix-turn-helix transcriptional regulator [Cupriavidus gilardii]|nr:helix-turn-helix transcriptional regulator [Cupriavidus gilardii]
MEDETGGRQPDALPPLLLSAFCSATTAGVRELAALPANILAFGYLGERLPDGSMRLFRLDTIALGANDASSAGGPPLWLGAALFKEPSAAAAGAPLGDSLFLLHGALPAYRGQARGTPVYLLPLRQDWAARALGYAVSALPLGAQLPLSVPLATYLRAQMLLLARLAPGLSREESIAMVLATVELAATLLRTWADAAAAPPPSGLRTQDPAAPSPAAARIYRAALAHIATHLSDPQLTGQRLARAVGCSRPTLYRAFAMHGTTVAARLLDARMAHARALLEAAGDTAKLAGIAFDCGYADVSAFIRAFRRAHGVTPRQWRQRAHSLPSRGVRQPADR